MLQACLNGARTPDDHAAVPRTPEALAQDFAACVAAGADEGHVHPFHAGVESVSCEHLAAVVDACRTVGRRFGVSTHDMIKTPDGMVNEILRWTARPDYASVNFYQDDSVEIRHVLDAVGVGVEAGVWTLADIAKLKDGPPPLRIMIEILIDDPSTALLEADRVMSALDKVDTQTPRLLHGEGNSAWPLLRRAQALGLDGRIGFEDVLIDEDGSRAVSNAALVATACRSGQTADTNRS